MKDEKITIRISESEKEALKALAASKDIPMSQLIREAIKSYIQEVKNNGSTKPNDCDNRA